MNKKVIKKEELEKVKIYKDFMNQKEFALYIGNSEPYVSKLVRDKKIIKFKGKVDVKKSMILLKKSSDPIKSKNPLIINDIPDEVKGNLTDEEINEILDGEEDPENINQSKSRKEYFLSKIQELNYLKEKKILIEAELVERQYFNIARLLRDKIFNLKHRISSQLAVISDVDKISNLLDKEFRNIFNEIEESIKEELKEDEDNE